MSTDELDPWERQPGETGMAYAAFLVYRGLGLTRTLSKTLANVGVRPDGKPKHGLSMIKEWSARYGWVERAVEFDREEDRLYRASQLELRKEAAKDQRNIARAMLGVVGDRLRKDQRVLADKLSMPQLARWAEVAIKIERLALGDATEIVDTGEHGERPVDDGVLDILGDEEATGMALDLLDRMAVVRAGAQAGD